MSYQRDAIKIAKFALKNKRNLKRVYVFTSLTIQAGLSTIHPKMLDVDDKGASSSHLWTMKGDGFRYWERHENSLFKRLKAAVKAGDVMDAMDTLTEVPGLGLAKSGFLCQMLGLDVACLDSHNLARLGLPATSYKLAKGIKHDLKMRKIADYVDYTRKSGGAEYWWNTWCAYVAGNSANKTLPNADAVSAYHWTAITQTSM